MEVFDQRGLLPGFGAPEKSPMGHFGGVQFDYTVLEDAHFGARGIPQSRTEAVLEEWAGERGADIRRGWELAELVDDGDGVEIVAATPEGEQRLRGAYLVGCDGGQSVVRGAAGFDFPGLPATRRMYLADVTGCDIRPRFLGERLDNGMVMAAPLAPGVDRIIVCEDGTPAGDRPGRWSSTRSPPPGSASPASRWPGAVPTGSAPSRTPPGRSPPTAGAGCCSPGTPRTSISRPAARGSARASRTRSTSAGSWPR